MGCLCIGDFLVCILYIYIYSYKYIYIYTYIYVVRQGGCDYLSVSTYVLLLSRAWDHVGSQDKIRKRAEGLKMKSKSYFIWARIPQRHASNLRNLQGLNPEILESYNGNWPYVRWAGALSKPVDPTHGIPAGCPLAIGMLHLFLLLAMRSTTDQAQETKLRTYADGWTLIAQRLRRKAAYDIVGSFAAATDELRRTGMVVSLTNSVILASGSSAKAVHRQVAGAFGAQVAVHVKDLGVDDTHAATKRVPAQRKKMGDAIASAARIAKLPHGWKSRARLTASLSKNQSKWGMDITGLPGHAAGRLRSAYLRAVSGGNAARRAPEVILALVAPQRFLDPALGLTHQVILSWAKRVAMDHSRGVGCPSLDEGD